MKVQQSIESMRLAGEKFENLQGARNEKARPRWRGRASWFGVAVTYFRVRMHTIIGANPFHGPVRDGKVWFQSAVGTRHNLSPRRFRDEANSGGSKGYDCTA